MKRIQVLSVLLFLCSFLNAQKLEIIGNGNLRSGPSTTNEVIGKVVIGTIVNQIDFSNDWYKVELPSKSTGWVFKTLVKIEKQSNFINPQKPDSIQVTVNVLSDAMRDVILGYYKNKVSHPLVSKLLITQEYPLKVNLSLDKKGDLQIAGKNDTLSIKGLAKISESGELGFITQVVSDPDAQKAQEGFSSNANWKKMVACFEGGEVNCAGYYLLKESIPLYFESGQIIFTENEKPGTFSEGSIFYYNSIGYKYTNSKWVKFAER